jgi:dihydroorotase
VYDLLIKNGLVLDPAQNIYAEMDIAIEDRKIAALNSHLSENTAKKSIDANGKLVTPGLLDIHTHVAEAIMPLAVNPDETGVTTGVTTVVDAGSTGYANFNGFKKLVIPKSKTDILCFINLSPTGQAIIPEICWKNIDPERIQDLIAQNRDIIRGIKFRAGAGVIEELGVEGVEIAKKIANQADIPIAVHIGIGLEESISDEKLNEFTPKMLSILDKGDILVHTFTHRQGGVICADGTVLPELIEAIKRGLILDVSPGSSHFSFEMCRIGMEQGIVPDTISTDVVNTNIGGPVVFSLPVIMSKFLALGLSLEQVIEKTTISPAKVLKEEELRGALRVGMLADISIFEIKQGEFLFTDGKAGNTLEGKQLLVPKLTLKSGEEIEAKHRFRNFIPGEQIIFPKGT